MVEFALILVPLMLLVIGMLQFGIVLNAKIDETHLASTGARYAAVNQNPGADMPEGYSLQDFIKQAADTGDLRSTSTVCVDFPLGTSEVGDPVRVTMTYDYELLPLLGGVTIPVQGEATMRLEAVPDPEVFSGGCST